MRADVELGIRRDIIRTLHKGHLCKRGGGGNDGIFYYLSHYDALCYSYLSVFTQQMRGYGRRADGPIKGGKIVARARAGAAILKLRRIKKNEKCSRARVRVCSARMKTKRHI